MKTLFIFLFLIGFSVQSQQTLYVNCQSENIIFRNETKTYKKIVFENGFTFLMQDNSTMTLKGMEGMGYIIRGDAGGGVLVPELGIDRRPGDVNPKLILVGCRRLYTNLTVGANIDVAYQGRCKNIRFNTN